MLLPDANGYVGPLAIHRDAQQNAAFAETAVEVPRVDGRKPEADESPDHPARRGARARADQRRAEHASCHDRADAGRSSEPSSPSTPPSPPPLTASVAAPAAALSAA